MAPLPLSGTHVLELAQGIAGSYAAKLLAQLGAEVVKVEPPEGDVARRLGPFAGHRPHPERSGLFAYLNVGKRGVVLDLHTPAGQQACTALATRAEVLIESFSGGELQRLGLELDASPVRVSVTPFGQWGARAGWRGNDLIAFHHAGFAYGFPALQVERADLPPLNAPTYAAEFLAGQVAAAAAVHGLLAAQRTGQACHLDVSIEEAVAAANNARFNAVPGGSASGMKRVFSDRPANSTVALLPCADGWVAISPREEHQWARWLEVMGNPDWAQEPRFADRAARDRNWAELYPLMAEWTRRQTKLALFEAAQARRVACFPLGTATDLLGSPQLAARAFFTQLDDPELGTHVLVPDRPYQLVVDGEPAPSRPERRRAPRLGEHTASVLVELRTPGRARTRAAAADGEASVRPLAGVRIVDFSWVLTGPIATRTLAALGAEVIKVESATRADLSHRDVAWEELNPGKRSITLNLKHPRARELAQTLIARSHVVVENFSSGVMERLGLDYPRLRQLHPRLIFASSSALGRDGPDRELVAYGTLIQCFAGWAALSAYPDRPPRSPGGVWTDPLTAAFETLLILAALWRQRESGQGAFIDLSMAETTIAALPEPILAWCLNAEVLQPRGNRHPVYAPQGCYPAAGEDRWVAVSVQSDAEWQRLCRLMQREDLLSDGRFATSDGRRAQHDLLDVAIGTWTRQRSAETTAALLQAHGIAAAPTREPTELLQDPHLRARGFVRHTPRLDGSGSLTSLGVPWLVDGQRPAACGQPPRLGEANAYVFQELLGLDDAECAKLVREQVIY